MISGAVTLHWQTEAEAILEENLINLMNSSYLTTHNTQSATRGTASNMTDVVCL